MLHEKLKDKYLESGTIEFLLKDSEIIVLKDFLDNWDVVNKFNAKYYMHKLPKVVLCGINPGKNGAGKTGVPFLDFASLSKMTEGVHRQDTERSAQFFYDIVQEIGLERFYRSFYVTNISYVGYSKGNKNLNYYNLPSVARTFVYEMFKYEMELVSPTTIISLSGEVKNTLIELFHNSDINIESQLPHPNYCSFPSRYDECKEKYLRLLTQYVID